MLQVQERVEHQERKCKRTRISPSKFLIAFKLFELEVPVLRVVKRLNSNTTAQTLHPHKGEDI